jgi:hypothetical protein
MISPGKYRSPWWLALIVSFLSVASAVIHGIGVQVTTGAIGFLDYAEFVVNVPLDRAETIDSRQRLVLRAVRWPLHALLGPQRDLASKQSKLQRSMA